MKKLYFLLLIVIAGCDSTEKVEQVEFAPFSNAVVEINYESLKASDTLYIEAEASAIIPGDLSQSNKLKVYEDGVYYLDLKIDRPVSSKVIINDLEYNILVKPNDTTEVILKKTDEVNLAFTGDNRNINEYYQRKKDFLGYADIRFPLNQHLTSRSTFQSVKQKTDSITGVELSFLENYLLSHELPGWIVDYETAEITYAGAGFKTTLPAYNRRFNLISDLLPKNYFDYLDTLAVDNHSAVASVWYYWFLSDYFLKSPPAEIDELSGFERASKVRAYMLEQSKSELTGQVREVYYTSLFSDILQFYTDSLEIDSVASEFEVSDYQSLMKMSGLRAKGGVEYLNLIPGDTIPDFYVVDVLDSVLTVREFSDEVLYVNFWATWCKPCIHNFPALNDMITEFSSDDRITFLNICIDSDKDKWLSAVSKHGLQGSNVFAEGNWNAKLRGYFNVKGIPHYMIIGKDNVLIENYVNKAPKVQTQLAEILEVL